MCACGDFVFIFYRLEQGKWANLHLSETILNPLAEIADIMRLTGRSVGR